MHCFRARRFLTIALVLVLTSPEWVFAQYGGGPGGMGRGRGGGGGGMRRMREEYERMQNQTPAANNATDKPKDEKKDEKPADEKKEAPPQYLTRPPVYDNSASLADQKMTVDSKRMVSFNFQEAPWTFVLEELAIVSGMNLDWTQLPMDGLNLRSNKKYTVADARDVINEHLLARGFSMLVDAKNSTISVVNLDNMNTALVPRVAPEDLDTLPPHDLVKVSFRLDWLLAKNMVDEFKQLLSPKAKLLPMTATNRLEAVDAVINLKQLAALLEEEQGRGSLNRLAPEFELRYTRAPEVVDQLETFLGLKKPGTGTPQQGGDAMQQMFMQRMQAMQAQQGQQGQPQPSTQQQPEIHLLANVRRNTVIVHAPPDKIGIIKAAIWKIDVPSDRPSLSDNTQMMQSYHLATLDPEVVVNFLETVGDLDPQTRLDADKKTKTVIACATPKDQKVIAALVKNLDGADRNLKVIQLRRLDADMVAGTLKILMPGEEKPANNNNNNNYGRRFGWFSPFGSGNTTTEEAPASKFRVEADVVANRLLVLANSVELDQVYKCLAELGEVPRHEKGQDTMRVLDMGASNEEQIMLERLRHVWPSLGKDRNKLIIDVPKGKNEKETPATDETKPDRSEPKVPAAGAARPVPSASNTSDKPSRVEGPPAERLSEVLPAPVMRLADFKQVVPAAAPALADSGNGTRKPDAAAPDSVSPRSGHHHFRGSRNRILQQQPPAAEKASPATKAGSETSSPNGVNQNGVSQNGANPKDANPHEGEPIYITRGPDGRLVISSRDTEALDSLEEMMGHLAPPRKKYAVFYLKHADAYAVKANLDDFFQTEKKENGEDRFRRWWSDDEPAKKDDTPKLSRRMPLRLIVDSQTNSILVQGGSADQLSQIEELINMYDNPKPVNTRPARVTQIFQIRHSKASVIAEVIKDVYRDLLSTKDKALESYNQTKSQGRGGQRGYISYDFGEHEDDGKMSQERFNGALSMGIDDSTNTLLVSCATQNMMVNISTIIEKLDTAAVPAAQSFQVLQINRSIDTNALQKKLTELLKKPTTTQQQPGQQPGQPQQQQQQQRRGRGNYNQSGGEND